MSKTYVIGDVHGEYKTVVALVRKLPKDAEIVFVGDLIDRGSNSREVIEFVRKNGYRCVLGNHEEFMIEYGKSFVKHYPKSANSSFLHTWYNNGGDATLFSYALVKYTGGLTCIENEEGIQQFKDDMEWLKTLPLYIELPNKINNKPVVITHASCGDVWHHHNSPNGVEIFREYALWNRKNPKEDSEIFNIFGHTPVDFGVEIEESFVNVDTGCYIKKHGYNILSAYCVESGEIVSVNRVE
ncbi:MAG: metallophosphoesterase [Campylobacterota bacterium]|nr:metallophosphoesterase [Campylobacterota bacterium]